MEKLNVGAVFTESETEFCQRCGSPVRYVSFAAAKRPIRLACECILKEKRMQEAQERKKQEKVIRHKLVLSSGLNLSQQGMTFDTFQVTPETQRAVKICKAFSERWRESKGKGILLTGGVGCGKSHLAAAICNQVIADFDSEKMVKQRFSDVHLERCCPVRFQSSVELYSSLRQEMKSGGETLKKCKESPLLILDDLGAERGSGWVTERLFELVDYRMGNKLPMVITTNLTAQQLSYTFGERIMDRVRSMCCLVELSGASKRMKC